MGLNVGLELTAASKESQKDCQVRGSPENVGSSSLGRRLVWNTWLLTIGVVICVVTVVES